MKRVLVAMSGGVDSSVSAYLLKQQGYEVIGVFMRHGISTSAGFAKGGKERSLPVVQRPKQGCCSVTDAEDARRVADRLAIPIYVLNFEEDFHQIVEYFVDEYLRGRTPNPCIVCNNRLKFGKLFDYAYSLKADFIATGHHARILSTSDGSYGLFTGRDANKDQSYVLFGIRREHLPRLLFPAGEYRKADIRKIAAEIGLRVADKPDSQEICFVADGDHPRFVREYRPDADTSGEIVSTDGKVLGRHTGLEQFTIGQRKGLRVALGEPRYVVKIEPETRRIVIGTRAELARWELTASDANWLIDLPSEPFSCQAKIRYRTAAVPATVTILGPNRFHVRFENPCYGVAPGQAVVCYQQDRVLGGGWIESSTAEEERG
ncbi:MAG: tRNA 2-thiouridine(34) synthase MnmA [Thermogutta sp.]